MNDMPRKAQGSGSIRQRPDGRWEGRYSIERDTGTGKQQQRSVYGKTQAEVRKRLQAITASIDDGVYTKPSKITVSAWLDLWLQEYTGNVKPRTLESYRAIIDKHLKPAFGAVKLTTLTTPAIQALYNRKKDLSAKSIRNVHGVLHKALEQAVDIDYIHANPASKCKLPRVEKADIKPLDIPDTLQAIKGHRFETLFTVGLFTGMRISEILGLT